MIYLNCKVRKRVVKYYYLWDKAPGLFSLKRKIHESAWGKTDVTEEC